VRVELSWAISASDLGAADCCVCNKGFERGFIVADLISDSNRLHLGEVCPTCLKRGTDHIGERMRSNLRFSYTWAEIQAYMEKRASEEDLEDCPSFEEFEALEAGCGGVRYATKQAAEDAWFRGEW
jgi:hypothetical protein